jgi:DNA-binding NarL/FixJ family response regulator
MIRVLLADDHAGIRRRARRLVEETGECNVCGEASNGRAAVDEALRLKPAVIVLDIHMPEVGGFEAARQIRRILTSVEFAILTLHWSEEFVRQALEAGARSYMMKSDAARHLLNAVRALSRHRPYFTPQLTPVLLERVLGDGHEKAPPTAASPHGRP